MLTTILFTYKVVVKSGWNYFDMGLAPYNIWVCIETIGFIVFAFAFEKKIAQNRLGKLIRWFSRQTLGIYVIHPVVMTILKELQIFNQWEDGDLRNIFVLIIILLVSVIIVTVVKKVVPYKIRKYIF